MDALKVIEMANQLVEEPMAENIEQAMQLIAGHSAYDEMTGSVDENGCGWRFSNWIAIEDGQGFVHTFDFLTESIAREIFEIWVAENYRGG